MNVPCILPEKELPPPFPAKTDLLLVPPERHALCTYRRGRISHVLPIGMDSLTLTHLLAMSDRFICASLEFMFTTLTMHKSSFTSRMTSLFKVTGSKRIRSAKQQNLQVFGSKLPGEPLALLQFYMLGSSSRKLCTHLGLAQPCCSGSAFPDDCDTSL